MTGPKLPGQTCPTCNVRTDDYTAVEDGVLPTPGDVVICLYCVGINVFGEGLVMRAATADEQSELMSDPEFVKTRAKVWMTKQIRDGNFLLVPQPGMN